MKRWKYFTFASTAAIAAVPAARAGAFLSQDQALQTAFPPGTHIERRTVFLTVEQQERVRKLSGSAPHALVIAYRGEKDGRYVGTALFDTHTVRTQPETIMVLVSQDGTIGRIEVLSFAEPLDYLPKPNWYRQFSGRALDENLNANRGIRAVTGATLTVRATVEAARRLLAVARTIEHAAPPAAP